jgi:hypothetical protein
MHTAPSGFSFYNRLYFIIDLCIYIIGVFLVFFEPARYRVIKIARSSSEVVLRPTEYTMIYPGLGPSSEV